jgi:raffinose/stachyose/melibiose transport system permease protein
VKRSRGTLRYALLAIFAVPWIGVPFWLLLVNSFKTEGDASVLSMSWPHTWNAAANYAKVITAGQYLTGLKNSAMLAIPTIVVVLLFGSMAAWAYARSPARSLRFGYYSAALSIVLPPAIIPTVYVLTRLGLNGTQLGYILAMTGTRLGIVTFLATGFVRALPADFEEAAQIDGASKFRIYWSVILPLLSPLLFTSGVLLVISVWNDFYFALFLLQGSGSATLPLTLYQFASSSVHGMAWNLVFAHVALTSLPLLIIYIVLQGRVLSGLTEGGVVG